MYSIGELIIYGNTGVCRVEQVESRKADGALCYTLQPLYQTCTICVPVDTTKVFMRPVLTREEAEALIAGIPQVQAEAYHNKAMRQLTEHYEEKLRSHRCEDLVELTMSLHAKRQDAAEKGRRFGAVDERYMKRAEELLFGELAAALGMDREAVPAYIQSRLQAE